MCALQAKQRTAKRNFVPDRAIEFPWVVYVPGRQAEGNEEAICAMMYCSICRKHKDCPTGIALGTAEIKKDSLKDHYLSAKLVAAQKAYDERLKAQTPELRQAKLHYGK